MSERFESVDAELGALGVSDERVAEILERFAADDRTDLEEVDQELASLQEQMSDLESILERARASVSLAEVALPPVVESAPTGVVAAVFDDAVVDDANVEGTVEEAAVIGSHLSAEDLFGDEEYGEPAELGRGDAGSDIAALLEDVPATDSTEEPLGALDPDLGGLSEQLESVPPSVHPEITDEDFGPDEEVPSESTNVFSIGDIAAIEKHALAVGEEVARAHSSRPPPPSGPAISPSDVPADAAVPVEASASDAEIDAILGASIPVETEASAAADEDLPEDLFEDFELLGDDDLLVVEEDEELPRSGPPPTPPPHPGSVVPAPTNVIEVAVPEGEDVETGEEGDEKRSSFFKKLFGND